MAKPVKPKERTRVSPSGAIITRSKTVDSKGTVTKRRSVTRRDRIDYGGLNAISIKSKVKQKFADGSTRKVKSFSSKESPFINENKWSRQTSAVKEKTAKKGLLNKAKSLVTRSNKSGKEISASQNIPSFEKKMNYNSAKKQVKKLQQAIKYDSDKRRYKE
jgi:hypothetical protein